MVVTQAWNLNLPSPQPPLLSHPSSSSSSSSLKEITSLLFEPFSQSLALMHSDSSVLLFSSLSLFSPPPPPLSPSLTLPPVPQQTLIPPFSTSSCFLRLHSKPSSSDGRVMFIVAGPHSGGTRVLLRFWVLGKNKVFTKAQVDCTQKDLRFDEKLGVVVDLPHGFAVKLVGSVNYFALHSVSARKIWVFGAKMVGGVDDDSMRLNLVKSAVIDCTLPICSITVSLGFLVLGEENGVRVFALRSLVKGGIKKVRDSGRRREKSNHQNGGFSSDVVKHRETGLPNGVIRKINGSNGLYFSSLDSSKIAISSHVNKNTAPGGITEIISHDCTRQTDVSGVTAKMRTMKLKQDSSVGGAVFVAFEGPEVHKQKSKASLVSLKALSVHALSKKSFLVLDSGGDLHLLSLCATSLGSEITGHMRPLTQTIKVQILAVHPDLSSRMQTMWISDGLNTLQMMSIADIATPVNETEDNEAEAKLMQISAIQAIFASEKIQDVIPLSTNAILVLSQGKIYAYAIS